MKQQALEEGTGCPEICPACGQMCCGACRTLSTFAQIENCPTSVATCRAPRPIRYNQLQCNVTTDHDSDEDS